MGLWVIQRGAEFGRSRVEAYLEGLVGHSGPIKDAGESFGPFQAPAAHFNATTGSTQMF